MIKHLVFICLLLIPFIIFSQDSLFVHLKPNNNYNQLILYKVEGTQQKYITHSNSETDSFKMEFPTESESGMYRLYFDTQNSGFFEVLYNQETIEVTFDPLRADDSAVFSKSKENKVYQTYIQVINEQQLRVDSLQMAYFESPDKENIKKEYESMIEDLNELQDLYEEKAINLMAQDFIKSRRKYNPKVVSETSEIYLDAITKHFFDAIDFNNESIKNSSFFIDLAIEYIFYVNNSEDAITNKLIKQQAINEVMHQIGENYEVKSEIINSLLLAFAGQQEIGLVAFIKSNHYENLPVGLKNENFIVQIDDMLKTAIGSIAPEISWKQDGKIMHLSELDSAQNYIIIFWSTTCPHCLNEIPKLYAFTENLKDIQVVAVALEDDAIGFKNQTKTMTNWFNVLGLNKWDNEFARAYDINSTPSYFILDKDKRIMEKPEELEDLVIYISN